MLCTGTSGMKALPAGLSLPGARDENFDDPTDDATANENDFDVL